jgi:hypothetical protein
VWQSNPALTGAQMRERLRNTADPMPVGGVSPNTTWGFGKINALAAVRNSVASITAPATATPGSVVSLASENSSAAFPGNNLTFSWSFTARPAGSTAVLVSPSSASTVFTPDVSGNYIVGLTVSQTSPTLTPPGSATATIHVNNIPSVTSIAGPGSSDNTAPVSFKGTGFDLDGQPLTFHWVLVSRPAGSASTLPASNVDNVPLAPDVVGTYEVGLRVDDGLDNSPLAIHAFTAGVVAPPSSSGGGGGGGCGLATGRNEPGGIPPLVTVVILFFPAGALAARRYARSRNVLRREGKEPSRHF